MVVTLHVIAGVRAIKSPDNKHAIIQHLEIQATVYTQESLSSSQQRSNQTAHLDARVTALIDHWLHVVPAVGSRVIGLNRLQTVLAVKSTHLKTFMLISMLHKVYQWD